MYTHVKFPLAACARFDAVCIVPTGPAIEFRDRFPTLKRGPNNRSAYGAGGAWRGGVRGFPGPQMRGTWGTHLRWLICIPLGHGPPAHPVRDGARVAQGETLGQREGRRSRPVGPARICAAKCRTGWRRWASQDSLRPSGARGLLRGTVPRVASARRTPPWAIFVSSLREEGGRPKLKRGANERCAYGAGEWRVGGRGFPGPQMRGTWGTHFRWLICIPSDPGHPPDNPPLHRAELTARRSRAQNPALPLKSITDEKQDLGHQSPHSDHCRKRLVSGSQTRGTRVLVRNAD